MLVRAFNGVKPANKGWQLMIGCEDQTCRHDSKMGNLVSFDFKKSAFDSTFSCFAEAGPGLLRVTDQVFATESTGPSESKLLF